MAVSPTDTAFIIGYYKYSNWRRALVIARNPVEAKRQAETGLPQEGLHDIRILTTLSEKVETAQGRENGVVKL